MKARNWMLAMFATTSVLAAASAGAQSWDAQQTAVWAVVEMTWKMDEQKDGSWITGMTHAKVSGWSMSNPAPRGQASPAGTSTPARTARC